MNICMILFRSTVKSIDVTYDSVMNIVCSVVLFYNVFVFKTVSQFYCSVCFCLLFCRVFSFLDVVSLCRCAQVSKVIVWYNNTD